jgi:hypothetical protein
MKPVLLGMNNPVSDNPRHALYPSPHGCTGYRLWMMLKSRTGATEKEYLDAFERRNVLTGPWFPERAREHLLGLGPDDVPIVDVMRGRTVVCLGSEIRDLLGLAKVWVLPQEKWGVTWRPIPHPSGRNHWYNDANNTAAVSVLLEELYRACHGEEQK